MQESEGAAGKGHCCCCVCAGDFQGSRSPAFVQLSWGCSACWLWCLRMHSCACKWLSPVWGRTAEGWLNPAFRWGSQEHALVPLPPGMKFLAQCWASVSSSALLAPFFPRVAPDAPANAALPLPSFWSEPAALQDQMGREPQSRSDAASRLSLRGPRSAAMAGAVLPTPVPAEALDWGRKLLSDAGLGLFVLF